MPIRKEYSANLEIGRVYDNVAAVVNPIESDRILNRVIVNTVLSFGNNTITHNLGRQPVGWIIIDRDQIGMQRRESWNSTQIVIYSNQVNDFNASILIF